MILGFVIGVCPKVKSVIVIFCHSSWSVQWWPSFKGWAMSVIVAEVTEVELRCAGPVAADLPLSTSLILLV